MQKIIIDVREPQEFAEGHIEEALNIPLANLMKNPHELEDISKDAEIILYCRSGARSNAAIEILRALGYKNLINGINQEHIAALYSS